MTTEIKRRAKKGTPKEASRPRSDVYKSVALYRDEAAWAADLAAEKKVTIGEFLSPKIREWLFSEHQALLRRKLAGGSKPPPPPGG